uniref:MAK10-like protein n=1 Tax=Tanacetum cinerariifolium TaxID=118510 RepID=A0A6L2LDP5_TANCI|nr:MAK10-like protein [Tanacetum cinerariifolium]
MGDENPPHAIGDYSRPSHEGYRNTIEFPDGNNVVPLRSNTIRQAIDHLTGGKLRDKSAKESWKIIENLALYDHESRNDPRDLAKPIMAIYLPHDVSSTSNHLLIELENQVQCLMEAHLAPKPSVQVNKIASSRGILATVGTVIDCKKAKIAVGDGFTRSIFRVKEIGLEKDHLPGELERARDAELNIFKDVLMFRKMMKFLGAIPINLKRNMRESKDLIENKINWRRPPKEGDAFENLWKEIHVTWAQLDKKRDEDTTLQDFDRAMDLQCVETASQFLLTPSKFEGDDIAIFFNAVSLADLKKPKEDLAGRLRRD